MGALRRATVAEVTDLVAGDAQWWPGFCGGVAEKGQVALREELQMRGWSWGALWQWIVGDVERYAQYQQALEAYVQGLALETVGIADEESDPADRKVKIDTRFRLAGKVDRARWGDKVDVSGTVNHTHSLIGILSGMTVEAEDADVIEPVALPEPEHEEI